MLDCTLTKKVWPDICVCFYVIASVCCLWALLPDLKWINEWMNWTSFEFKWMSTQILRCRTSNKSYLEIFSRSVRSLNVSIMSPLMCRFLGMSIPEFRQSCSCMAIKIFQTPDSDTNWKPVFIDVWRLQFFFEYSSSKVILELFEVSIDIEYSEQP